MSPVTISLGFLPLHAWKRLSLGFSTKPDLTQTWHKWAELPFLNFFFIFSSLRLVESSNQVLEVEKKLQEGQWRRHMVEQQLEMLQVDPKSSTTAQSPALRSRKGEGGLSATATSPISPLGLIDSDNTRAPSAKPSWVLDLARGDGACSDPAAKSWPLLIEEDFPAGLSGIRIFTACFHGITPGKKSIPLLCVAPRAPFALLPEGFSWRLRAELKDASQFKACQCLWKTVAGDEVIRSGVIYYPMNVIISCYKYESLPGVVKEEEFMVDVKFLFPWSDPFIA